MYDTYTTGRRRTFFLFFFLLLLLLLVVNVGVYVVLQLTRKRPFGFSFSCCCFVGDVRGRYADADVPVWRGRGVACLGLRGVGDVRDLPLDD